jgi:hypothetical protein
MVVSQLKMTTGDYLMTDGCVAMSAAYLGQPLMYIAPLSSDSLDVVFLLPSLQALLLREKRW